MLLDQQHSLLCYPSYTLLSTIIMYSEVGIENNMYCAGIVWINPVTTTTNIEHMHLIPSPTRPKSAN